MLLATYTMTLCSNYHATVIDSLFALICNDKDTDKIDNEVRFHISRLRVLNILFSFKFATSQYPYNINTGIEQHSVYNLFSYCKQVDHGLTVGLGERTHFIFSLDIYAWRVSGRKNTRENLKFLQYIQGNI